MRMVFACFPSGLWPYLHHTYVQAGMSATPGKPKPEFTRRSETESICMWCFATIRVITPDLLANEEPEHAVNCIQRPDSPLRKPWP